MKKKKKNNKEGILTKDLIAIASKSANLVIDVTDRSFDDLYNIMYAVGSKRGNIRFTNCNSLTISKLQKLTSPYPRSVTLDFS